MTVYDFIESVTYWEDGRIVTAKSAQIDREYRRTLFSGPCSRLILEAVFRFSPSQVEGNPISERLRWSHTQQDWSSPNCGSVFREYFQPIARLLMGWKFGKARYSEKTENWLLNESPNPLCLRFLIKAAMFLHRICGKRAKLEISEVA